MQPTYHRSLGCRNILRLTYLLPFDCLVIISSDLLVYSMSEQPSTPRVRSPLQKPPWIPPFNIRHLDIKEPRTVQTHYSLRLKDSPTTRGATLLSLAKLGIPGVLSVS